VKYEWKYLCVKPPQEMAKKRVKGTACFAMEHPLYEFNQGTKWQIEEEKPDLKTG